MLQGEFQKYIILRLPLAALYIRNSQRNLFSRHPLFDTSPLAKASKALHLTPTPNVGITWFNAMLPRLMQVCFPPGTGGVIRDVTRSQRQKKLPSTDRTSRASHPQGKNRPARLDYLVDLSPECDFPAAEGMEKGKEEEK